MSKQNYIEALNWRLATIREELATLRQQIQEAFSEIEVKQKQASYLAELLSAEGVQLDDQDLVDLVQVQIADKAYQYLDQQDGKTPFHYKDLANNLMAQGVLISGKDPAANLLSHISRDDRFVRVAPGTYALKKWGLQVTTSKKRRTKKRRPTAK
jgi:hypothetical protein